MCLTNTDGANWRANEEHSVCNRKGFRIKGKGSTIRRVGARRVNIHGNHFIVLIVEVEKLCDDEFRDRRHDRHAQVDDAIGQQERREIRGRTNLCSQYTRTGRR